MTIRPLSFLRRASQKLSLTPHPALVKAETRLTAFLTQNMDIRLDSIMMVTVPDHPQRFTPEQKLGTNRNFVKAVVKLLRKDPLKSELVINEIEELFSLAEGKGYNARTLISGVYVKMTIPTSKPAPVNSSELLDILARFCHMINYYSGLKKRDSFDFELSLIIRQGLQRK